MPEKRELTLVSALVIAVGWLAYQWGEERKGREQDRQELRQELRAVQGEIIRLVTEYRIPLTH